MCNKKILITLLLALSSFFTYAQEHITFNGATFGTDLSTFMSSVNCYIPDTRFVNHSHKDVYNRRFTNMGKINTYNACYYIHSSVKTNTVFETIAWFKAENLQDELKRYVATLEAKYGSHIKVNSEELGWIVNRRHTHDEISRHKEILALKYMIRSRKTNKVIGEIRISGAPEHSPSYEGDSGYIELTYRDYAAADSAMSEYKNTLSSIL